MTRRDFWVLAGANFAIALGYGVILPLLPTMLNDMAGVATPAAVAWHTAALLGSYMLGLFATAPLWGAVSDRIGGRGLLVFGMCGYAAALIAFAMAGSLTSAYSWRVLAGVAGGAVLPVVNTSIGNVPDRPVRARLFASASMATLLGLLAGPAVSALVYAAMQRMGDVSEMTSTILVLPTATAAVFALCVAVSVALGGVWTGAAYAADPARRAHRIVWRQASPALFASFLVLFGLGAFEAVLPVLNPTALSLNPPALGALLALCMVVMLAVQTGLFLVPILHRVARGPFLAAGFLVLAAGMALLGQAGSLAGAALAVVLVGAGGAFLQPAIAYLATLNDAGASGTLLGALTGAGSLGQGLGSFAGGALYATFDANGLWVLAVGLAGGAAWIGAPVRAGAARLN
ncbi:MAG: MFS transporter [Candidatus Accumulibacter meliphilus]|jgi:MFS family permease|uniref:MFS transporter n=1 Tax=Candidatus Accumulibacter meliphilus TaxID=2211374 RepID=UPI002FC2E33B